MSNRKVSEAARAFVPFLANRWPLFEEILSEQGIIAAEILMNEVDKEQGHNRETWHPTPEEEALSREAADETAVDGADYEDMTGKTLGDK